MKKHNFSAGPSILPEYTIKNTADAVLNFAGTGLSILEVSHRGKEFVAVMEEARQLFKDLLDVPAGYEVLFLGGGASTQFFTIPFNLLHKKAAYLETGVWAKKAIKEAKLLGDVDVVASSADTTFNYIPKGYTVPEDVDYFHITTNNTIYGTEILTDLDVPVRMVADMSSDIFSRPVDVSKYDLIYGGAQKNLAPSGATFVLVKEDVLGKSERVLPTMVDYRTHLKDSMFNTPPVLPVYSALQTMKWLKEQGGVAAIEKVNIEKANLLYNEIDRNKMFQGTVLNQEDRSRMNVCFVMAPEYAELEKEFFEFATAKGMSGIKGHRSVGGFRASLYNAMPMTSVQALVDTMKEFASTK
ncbi:3-phosphoserine/phosphohydroxythreonine transaminase [Prolixibacteraceae bacterium JC049]|jgi:phosphoserine aminotransferase|nr:3-phosphoserine/phosphohydroxythreonine transaminase [Prolixibacteraceae bacterium JC049]